MGYFEKFKKRMESYGSNALEDYKNSSIHLVNDAFSDIPSFRVVTINNVEVDSRIVQIGNQSDMQNILFRPGYIFSKGDYVTFDEGTWIMLDFFVNEIFPKGRITKCENELRWVTDGVTNVVPCAVSINLLYLEEENYVEVPDGTIIVRTQYNETTKSIKIKDKFVFGRSSFEVSVIDDFSDVYNEKGIMKITMKRIETSSKTSIENKVSVPSDSLESRWK